MCYANSIESMRQKDKSRIQLIFPSTAWYLAWAKLSFCPFKPRLKKKKNHHKHRDQTQKKICFH